MTTEPLYPTQPERLLTETANDVIEHLKKALDDYHAMSDAKHYTLAKLNLVAFIGEHSGVLFERIRALEAELAAERAGAPTPKLLDDIEWFVERAKPTLLPVDRMDIRESRLARLSRVVAWLDKQRSAPAARAGAWQPVVDGLTYGNGNGVWIRKEGRAVWFPGDDGSDMTLMLPETPVEIMLFWRKAGA